MRTVGLLITLFLLPIFVSAAALVNINTADATLLDTLPGIGPTYATRIVDYRTLHGPFASIVDIQDVSGIGPSTYAGIKPFITVGDTSVASTTDTATTTSATPSTSASGGTTTYVPPPSALSISVSGDLNALREVPIRFSARVTMKNGTIDPSAHILWSFGDGSGGEGSAVEKIYRYPGTYLVVVTASDGTAIVRDDLSVVVKSSQVRISAVTGEGITLTNDASERLDLSGWRLGTEMGSFRFPEGTILLPHANVLFPHAIINLPISLEVTLSYPNGMVAAHYPDPIPVVAADIVPQLSLENASYKQVQTVESFTSTKTNGQSYDEAVSAPAPVSIKETGAGAAVPPAAPLAAAVTAKTPATALFHSIWTLGLLGIMTLAGGVFILL